MKKVNKLLNILNEVSYYSPSAGHKIHIGTKYDLIIYFKETPKGKTYGHFDTLDSIYKYAKLFEPIRKKIPMKIVDVKTNKVLVNKKQFEKNFKEWIKKNK
ncbi:MAG: hypothetical protein ACTSXD_02100 [Candidatus Heimdallarchaeaceae archaeon]